MIQVTPVVLCGGSGTRLWPLSRSGFPKQFISIGCKESLFQKAMQRLMAIGNDTFAINAPLIVANEEHRFLASEQLREIGVNPSAFVLEPIGRNTAPALTLAALAAQESGEDPILVVSPADHAVTDPAAFTEAIQHAVFEAEHDAIIVLGVKPSKPETGYGYIKITSNKMKEAKTSLEVEKFFEKPSIEKAKQYLEEGDYYWNAGIFVLKASIWLKAIENLHSNIAQGTKLAWRERTVDSTANACFIRPSEAEFAEVPSDSIDCAVIERCLYKGFPLRMIELNAGWSDLGVWDAVWSAALKDIHGNANIGDVLISQSQNCLVYASSRLVSLVGVNDLVVVETPDAVLVSNRADSQGVKHIVRQLECIKREEHNLHRKVHRPWGWYDCVDEGGRFKVKRIQVKPKASLSLQKHYHRAEHWIVVSGTAEITIGDKKLTLTENQSTYIPLGEVHRLANPGAIPLEIIEVQSGPYLKEDDIIRFEDEYERNK